MSLGFLWGEFTSINLLLDPGVILCDLPYLVTAHQVSSTIAHTSDVQLILTTQDGSNNGRSHPRPGRVAGS
jgi:hypothetical protein